MSICFQDWITLCIYSQFSEPRCSPSRANWRYLCQHPSNVRRSRRNLLRLLVFDNQFLLRQNQYGNPHLYNSSNYWQLFQCEHDGVSDCLKQRWIPPKMVKLHGHLLSLWFSSDVEVDSYLFAVVLKGWMNDETLPGSSALFELAILSVRNDAV